MWKNDEIQVYFSLFGAAPVVLELVRERNLTRQDMDGMTMTRLKDFGILSNSVCDVMIKQWTTTCSGHENPLAALEAVEQAMESYAQVLAYKSDRNQAVYANVKQDAVDALKHSNLLQIIREQQARITELETRESAFVEELNKRADLVKELEAQVLDLVKIKEEKSLNTEEIKKNITQNHSLFHQKMDETKLNVNNIDQHVNSILRMAKQTVEIIQEEERNRGEGNLDITSDLNCNSRLIKIDQFAIVNLQKESSAFKSQLEANCGSVSLDPFVVFKLTDTILETKKMFNSGSNPTWDNLNIELRAVDDEYNKEYNKLTIEVWDDFAMNLSNELLCTGEISFTHLDLLLNRGHVMTSVDLVNANGQVVTTANINIEVTKGDLGDYSVRDHTSTNAIFTSTTSKIQYELGDQVLCNYGGEGEWLAGSIIKFKKIRDRSDTRRLYDIQFLNGDQEVNVPISRLRDVKVVSSSVKSGSRGEGHEKVVAGYSEGDNSGIQRQDGESQLTKLFQSNNEELLAVITDVQTCSHDTIASIMELDDWQKKLTQLLSDALRRYADINASAKKYSVYVNSLTEKIISIEHFLQRLEISEKKSDDMNAECVKLRTELEDLRKRLADMTQQRDKEINEHAHTKHLVEQEKQVTLACKKEILELRSELDRLIEVVRRDMSNRITNQNVNEELYSLSSTMVKTSLDGSMPAPSPAVMHNSSAIEHSDIFMQQHDWKLYLSLIKTDMTTQEVEEAHATLHNLNKSFEILSSRLVLECRHRAECDLKLLGAKEDLRAIKDDIITEATLRLQLEEEMQYFKETAETYKAEVEKHKKFSVIAKKAAYDAIKQARYFQQKLNIEIDHINDGDGGFGESKASLNQEGSRRSKSNKSSNKVLDLDDYDGLFDDTDDDASGQGNGNGGKRGRRPLTRSATGSSNRSNPNSPYLKGRKNNKNNPYHNLQTRSESEKDALHSHSHASMSSKKSKKIKMPGKKQMTYVGKKITRILGKNGSKSSAGITPYDDMSTSGKSGGGGKSPHKAWVNPGYINYAEKYSKEPPTAASRRTYTSQQQYD